MKARQCAKPRGAQKASGSSQRGRRRPGGPAALFRFPPPFRGRRGLTLLEVLLAMGIFAFIAVFLSRVSSYSLRQREKLGRSIKEMNIESNVLDVMRRDFRGHSPFFDSHFALRWSFPAWRPPPPGAAARPAAAPPAPPKLAPMTGRPGTFMTESRDFRFIGKTDEMEFPSAALISSFQGAARFQLVWIRYSFESCGLLDGGGASKCLIREFRGKKDPLGGEISGKPPQDRHVLFERIKNLAFSYYDKEGNDWKDEWSDLDREPRPDAPPFPRFVKAEIEWEEGSRKAPGAVYQFPVGRHFYSAGNQDLLMAFLFDMAAKGKAKPKEKQRKQGAGAPGAGQPGAGSKSRQGQGSQIPAGGSKDSSQSQQQAN